MHLLMLPRLPVSFQNLIYTESLVIEQLISHVGAVGLPGLKWQKISPDVSPPSFIRLVNLDLTSICWHCLHPSIQGVFSMM